MGASSGDEVTKGEDTRVRSEAIGNLDVHGSHGEAGDQNSPTFLDPPANNYVHRPKVVDTNVGEWAAEGFQSCRWKSRHFRRSWLRVAVLTELTSISYTIVHGAELRHVEPSSDVVEGSLVIHVTVPLVNAGNDQIRYRVALG